MKGKKEKKIVRIELEKDGVVTDWSEYCLGRKKPDITNLIKNLIEFLEETL